jgi:thioredoxin 1
MNEVNMNSKRPRPCSLKTVAALAVLMLVTTLTGCSPGGSGHTGGTSTSSTRVRTLDAANFDTEIGKGVVLVDFWAEWCGPCKTQAPIVEQVAEQVEGRAVVAKLDVDAASAIAGRLEIRAIPTLIVFKNGKPVRQFVGVTQAGPLVAAIDSAVESN